MCAPGRTNGYCFFAYYDIFLYFELFYWESEAKAEVDFVVMIDGKIIPIEVKSSENTRSYSLNSYIKKYSPNYAIRLSGKNFGFENGIKSVPLYAAYLI